MIGPLAPLRASASARRSLFTSAVRRFDPKDPNVTAVTSDFLARLQMKPTTGASSSAQGQSAHDAARNMIGSLGVRDASAADEGRHKFEPGQHTPPHAYKEENMYTQLTTPRVERPLLGPPKRIAKRTDPFHIRDTSPLEHVLNPLIVNQFVNPMGKIKSRAETALTWKSQRLVGKMVRRARAMGVISRWQNRPRPGGLGSADSY